VESSGPLDEKTVTKIGMQVCELLEFLHPTIVHQDITPDNLILEENGEVRLVDFNVARTFASESASIAVVGKHAYIPPEQFRGKATEQSDIYALGCTLHFLLTGQDPQPMTTSYPARVQAKISERISGMVSRATAQDLSTRYRTARELGEDLQQALDSDN